MNRNEFCGLTVRVVSLRNLQTTVDELRKNTIRVGLGDFIFYSVMVAKAAETSFTTFSACMLVVLVGLGGTLILLSVFHHALSALPI